MTGSISVKGTLIDKYAFQKKKTSEVFFLLERSVGMTHKQILKKLVQYTRNHLTQLGKEYSSNIESDGPVSLELSDMDLDGISLANGNEYTSGYFETAMHSDFYSNRSHQLAVERYTAMIAKDLPLENQIYVFDQYGTDHFRIITEDHSLEGLHEALFTVMITTDKKDILIDSGATSSVNVINNEDVTGLFMLVSKIVPLAKPASFTTYGGKVSELRILGWAWHRYCMICTISLEIVVIVARAYVAVDPTGMYRRIYSSGSLKEFGFSFIHGIPTELMITGTELVSTICGPSTDAYVITPAGNAIRCPSLSSHRSLQMLPIIDHTDPNLLAKVTRATKQEINLLTLAKANLRSNGTVDKDFFNQEVILKDFHTTNAVYSISVNVQPSIRKVPAARTPARPPTMAPIFDPVPTVEDLGVPTSEYGATLAQLMSTLERLHMAISENFGKHDEEFLKGNHIDPQTAHEKIQEVLCTLQELGDGLSKSDSTTVHSMNQLQECAVQAGFYANLPLELQPEKLLGFPGILSRESDDVVAFQHGREEPIHLPYLAMSDAEFDHRINSLGHHGDEYEHYETTENAELNSLESLTSGTLNPLGQVHVWIGMPSVEFFSLLYSDRRAHIHLFTESPVTEIYNLVNADMWCHFDVHRIPEANISADLISAVLSQSLVSLDQILTVHHECSDGKPSLQGLLSSMPTSASCLRTECNNGNFTVVSAWPDFDQSLIHFKYNPNSASEIEIKQRSAHYDNLRVAQITKLLELASENDLDESKFQSLQEVSLNLSRHTLRSA